MRRRIATAALLCVTVLLSAPACSGAPAGPTAASASPAPKAPRTTAAGGFTVSGNRQVPANGSQDTGAQAAGAACDSAQFAADKNLGSEIASGFAAANFPAAASLLRHFLAGPGTGVNYPPGSRISRLAGASSAFQAVNEQVQAAIAEIGRAHV